MMSARSVSGSRGSSTRKIVQRDHVPGFLQSTAGCHHQVIGGNGFKNLDHGLARRQQRDVILKQDLAGAVHKGPASVTKHIEAQQHGTVQRAAGSRVGIRTPEKIFDAITKQELVTEDFLVRRENRLAGDKMGSGLGHWFALHGAERRGRSSHSLSIGTASLNVSRHLVEPHRSARPCDRR